MNGGSEQQFLPPLPLDPLDPRMNSKPQEKRVIYNTKLTFGDSGIPLGGGFSLLGPNKLTLGPVDLFGPKKHRCLSKWDFGEIDFANDRLKLKINVNPTSWD